MQWKKLGQRENELAVSVTSAAVGDATLTSALPNEQGWQAHKAAPSVQQLQTQVSQQLSLAESLLSETTQLNAHTLERRRQRCASALNALQASCAGQLQDLSQAEAGPSAEWGAAAEQVQQLLTSAQPQDTDSCGQSGGDPTSASSLPAAGSLPPEVLALDAFLLRHGPTGEACTWYSGILLVPCEGSPGGCRKSTTCTASGLSAPTKTTKEWGRRASHFNTCAARRRLAP
jgi:ElaB/YqjD/DUF883 family membrane-anchored ribosome-binding protein